MHNGRKGDMKTAAFLCLVLALTAVPVAAQSRGAMSKEAAAERQRAIALEQEGKVPEAESEWSAYLKTNPGNPEPYAQLGLLEARLNHYSKAFRFIEKRWNSPPKTPMYLRFI